jgi:hypothetical protein
VVGLALPVAAAYLSIGRLLRPPADLASRTLLVGLALPAGIGAASLFTYGWLVAGGALGPTYAVADFLLFAGALAALRPWSVRAAPSARTEAVPLRNDERIALAVACVALTAAGVGFAQALVSSPIGGWDAWAIWNNHARFLFRGGERWTALLDPAMGFSHNEYPLLLPAAVARLWTYSRESAFAPGLVAGAFTLSTVLVVYGAVARRSGHVAGATAAMLLLATASFRLWGPAQYADVPVACLLAAAVACVMGTPPGDAASSRQLALAGALLGLSAWTKDEGLVLGALFGAWAVLLAGAGSAPLWRRAVALGAGAALPLAARAHFQLALAPSVPHAVTGGQPIGSLLGRLLVEDRWAAIAQELPPNLPGAETWLPLVAIVAAIVLGARWRELARSPALPAVIAWGAFLLVYGITSADLRWHIENSASRVFLQPWPALLLGLFSAAPLRGDARPEGAGS